ncbi:UNKNOWN [Stylonychia lemnae]|uniref:Uncharacterized protein n=1 Tax=Stylonychia lemnae TaxID=5949 RepID=A0A078A093_STYLE|nr:UNKNOWN [Stylonychia lemnae]|eukprot:CDW74203.1 UNKNOWN [Stylonychia lemnae]
MQKKEAILSESEYKQYLSNEFSDSSINQIDSTKKNSFGKNRRHSTKKSQTINGIKNVESNLKQEIKKEFENKFDLMSYSWILFQQGRDVSQIQGLESKIQSLNPYNQLTQWKKILSKGNDDDQMDKKESMLNSKIVRPRLEDVKSKLQSIRKKRATSVVRNRNNHTYTSQHMNDPQFKEKMSIIQFAMDKIQQEDKLQKLSQFQKNKMLLKYLQLTESLVPHCKVAVKKFDNPQASKSNSPRPQNQQVKQQNSTKPISQLAKSNDPSSQQQSIKVIKFSKNNTEYHGKSFGSFNQSNAYFDKGEETNDEEQKPLRLQLNPVRTSRKINDEFRMSFGDKPQASQIISQAQRRQKSESKLKQINHLQQSNEGAAILEDQHNEHQEDEAADMISLFPANHIYNKESALVSNQQSKNVLFTDMKHSAPEAQLLKAYKYSNLDKGFQTQTRQGGFGTFIEVANQSSKQNQKRDNFNASLNKIKDFCTSELTDQNQNLIIKKKQNEKNSINSYMQSYQVADGIFEQTMRKENQKYVRLQNLLGINNEDTGQLFENFEPSTNIIQVNNNELSHKIDNSKEARKSRLKNIMLLSSHGKRKTTINNNKDFSPLIRLTPQQEENLQIYHSFQIPATANNHKSRTPFEQQNHLNQQPLQQNTTQIRFETSPYMTQTFRREAQTQGSQIRITGKTQNLTEFPSPSTYDYKNMSKSSKLNRNSFYDHRAEQELKKQMNLENLANQTMQNLDKALSFFEEHVQTKEQQTKRTIREQADRLRNITKMQKKRVRTQQEISYF